MGYIQILKDAFSSLKYGSTWIFAILLLIVAIIYNVLSFAISFGSRLVNPLLYWLIIPLYIIFMIVLFIISIFVTLKALKILGLETSPFNVIKFVKLLLLSIAIAIISILSLLIIVILPTVVVSALLGSTAELIALVISSLVWFIIAIYFYIRFFLYWNIFLSKEIGIIDSLKEAWIITKGNVLKVFIALLILLFVLLAIGIILLIIFVVVLFILMIIAGVVTIAVKDLVISAIIVGALYLIIFFVLGLIINLLQIVMNYYSVAIYKELLGTSVQTQQTVQKPKTQTPKAKPAT